MQLTEIWAPTCASLFVASAAEDFHARYSAVSKTYSYRLVHGAVMSPFWTRFCASGGAAHSILLECANAPKRVQGRARLDGFFSRADGCRVAVRDITRMEIADGWDGRSRCHLIEFTVTAKRVFAYMVRSIVGTLLAVGRGEIDDETVTRGDPGRGSKIGGPDSAGRVA